MHPAYTSDKPGECPICGMTLEPVVGGDEAGTTEPQGGGNVPGLTTVTITPERIQLIGVRTARVQRSPVSGQLDLVGFVTANESRTRSVQIRVSGWVRELYVNQTGIEVRAGQPLMSIYSPELFQTEQEYLIARGGADSSMKMSHGISEGTAAERLRLLGVPDDEIRRLDHDGTASTQLVLRSPVSGTVLERGVMEGQHVGADTPLLTVADLSRVWVMADLYEMDMTRVHPGDSARFTSDAMPTRSFAGQVDFVYPTVSSETRTLKARLALDNPSGVLRPGMYGRVSVSTGGGSALVVPAEAVVNAGEHSYVFLAHAGGRFEPRMVRTGTPAGDRVQILSGVIEGDTVVSSASFLIDSESRLRAALHGMGASPGTGHAHGDTP
jgi:multidrug efflux pump subunit AcrA (membrane-fusion protein)